VKVFYVFLIVILGCSGCQTRDFDSPDELRKFIRDEEYGLSKTVKPGAFSVRVTYLPTDLMVYQELNAVKADPLLIETLRKKYGAHHYFLMEISKDSREALVMDNDSEVFGDLVNTLSFRMGQFVSMTSVKSDTLMLEDFILDRTYGMASSTNLMFVFKKKQLAEQQFSFNLKEFGLHTGDQKFRFFKKDIDNVPTLKFNVN
jgi:hypothetical protein